MRLKFRRGPAPQSLVTSLGLHRAIAHELRWHLANRERLASQVSEKLNLAEHYWLFILGINNSGTTLLERILRTHPLIRTLPDEGQFFTRGLPNPVTLGISRAWTLRLDRFRMTEVTRPMAALRVRYDWAACYESRPGVLLEKSPPNYIRARWLQHHFKPSKFIAISRHPYAVCEGMRRRMGWQIETGAIHWSIAQRIFLSDVERLDDCLRIRYEDLCADSERHLRMLSDFLALPTPLDSDLATTIRGKGIEGEVVGLRDFNALSRERLSRDELNTINRIAGAEMAALGYEQL